MKVIKRVVAKQYNKAKNKNFYTDVGVVLDENGRQTLILNFIPRDPRVALRLFDPRDASEAPPATDGSEDLDAPPSPDNMPF